MNKYLIIITMRDGSVGRAKGIFASDWDAIDSAFTSFADAINVVARRLA